MNEISRRHHLAELTAFRGTPIYAATRPGEVRRIALNPAQAKRWLGWSPQTTLIDGLRATMEGFRSAR